METFRKKGFGVKKGFHVEALGWNGETFLEKGATWKPLEIPIYGRYVETFFAGRGKGLDVETF